MLGRNLTLIAVHSDVAAQLTRGGQDGAIEPREADILELAVDDGPSTTSRTG